MIPTIVQFNARVPERLRQKIKQEAAVTGASVDTISVGMIQFFFRELPLARRRAIYEAVPSRKRNGKNANNGRDALPPGEDAARGEGAAGTDLRRGVAATAPLSQRGGEEATPNPAATGTAAAV